MTNEEPLKAIKHCWPWQHQWTAWRQFGASSQRKVCVKCGKTVERYVA